MKLSIHHRTIYRYARPVVLQPHRMMLRPRGSHDIAVVASSLVCTPPAEIDWTQDVFGNLIATGIFAELAAELVIASELTVEQSAVAWPVFRIAPEAHAFPFAYSPDDRADLGTLRLPEHGDPEGRMEGWARAFVRGGSTDTLSLLKDINAGILGPVGYRVRDEEGTQTPLETPLGALCVLGKGRRRVHGADDPPSARGDARHGIGVRPRASPGGIIHEIVGRLVDAIATRINGLSRIYGEEAAAEPVEVVEVKVGWG